MVLLNNFSITVNCDGKRLVMYRTCRKQKVSSNNTNNFSFNKKVIDLTSDNFNFFENMKQHWWNIKKLSETKRQQSNIDSRAIDTNNNKVSWSSRAQRQREEMEWDSHREPLKHIYILLRSTNSLIQGGGVLHNQAKNWPSCIPLFSFENDNIYHLRAV